jgi:hypothetical protein
MPAYSEHGKSGDTGTEKTEVSPSNAKPAVPPYEGRQTTAKPEDQDQGDEARTAGATHPVSDSDYKAPAPGQTAGGATASPADEQPASQMSEAEGEGDRVDAPAHTPGTGRGEQKI